MEINKLFPILLEINKLFSTYLEINSFFLKLPEKTRLFYPQNNLLVGLTTQKIPPARWLHIIYNSTSLNVF